MFETSTETSEFGPRRHRCQCGGEAEAHYGEVHGTGTYGEGPYGEAEYHAGEYETPYGEAEYHAGEYETPYGEAEYHAGEYETPYGEAEYHAGEYETPYGEAEYHAGEYETPYGEAEYHAGEYETPYGEAEYPTGEYETPYGEAEEHFLPFVPIVGNVLGGLLGGLAKESTSLYGGRVGEHSWNGSSPREAGEAGEYFLNRALATVLGPESQRGMPSVLSPAQESQLAARLLEVPNEAELEAFLGGIINTIGKAVQGVGRAASSLQGGALINALKPLAKAALPVVGGAVGSLIAPGIGSQIGAALGKTASSFFEMESSGGEAEQEFEAARHVVRLAAAAAQNVATAPPGQPPQLVGDLSVIDAARSTAPPLFGRAVRAVEPIAQEFEVIVRDHRRGSWTSPLRPPTVVRAAPPRSLPVRWSGTRYGYGPNLRYRGRPGWGYGYQPGWRYGYRPGWRYGYPPADVGTDPGSQPPAAVGAPEPPQPPPAQPGYKWVAVPIDAPPPAMAPPVEPATPAPPPADSTPPSQPEFGFGGYDRYRDGDYGSTGPSGRWVRRNGKIVVLGA